jgi:hypothetical protein
MDVEDDGSIALVGSSNSVSYLQQEVSLSESILSSCGYGMESATSPTRHPQVHTPVLEPGNGTRMLFSMKELGAALSPW